MAKSTLPVGIADITTEWLTAMLREQDDAGEATVTAIATTDIGTGVGFVGEIARIELTWDRDDDTLPASMIAKVPTSVERNRGLAEAIKAYEREHRVYTELGDTGIRMPHLHAAGCDPDPAPWLTALLQRAFEVLPIRVLMVLQPFLLWLAGKSTRRSILLLEDVDDARPPSQIAGGDADQVRAGLSILAQLHARWWNDPSLEEHADWLWPLDRTPKAIQAAYARRRDDFAGAAPSAVESGLMATLDRVQAEYPERMHALMEGPITLLHGDFRLDNLLFRPAGEIVVLDWQLSGIGHPAWDVGYFLIGAIDPVAGRSLEANFLRHYLDELAGHGVEPPSLSDFAPVVESCKELLAHRMVFAEEILDTDLGDGHSFVELMVSRLEGWIAPAA